jgi:hypothetical protein
MIQLKGMFLQCAEAVFKKITKYNQRNDFLLNQEDEIEDYFRSKRDIASGEIRVG